MHTVLTVDTLASTDNTDTKTKDQVNEERAKELSLRAAVRVALC